MGVAHGVAGILFAATNGGLLPLPASTPTPTTWAVSATATGVGADTPQPRCVLPAADTEPKSRSTQVRTLSAEGGDPAAALHQLDHYATPEDAAGAWEARVTQLGTCARSTAWLTGLYTIEGAAERAVAATLAFQGTQPEYHTIVVALAGTDVNIVDLSSAQQPWGVDVTAAALGALTTRQCTLTGSTCAPQTTPAITDRTPPATDPPGWLASVDLPRLTPGAGSWRGTDVAPLKLPGSACEATDLAGVAGATALQRTYLRNDDPRAQGVGVDEAIYTFATADEANALVGTLTANIDGCAGRTPTATVRRSGELLGTTGNGPSWYITQKVNGDQTARFRVSVVAVGSRVVYAFANPSESVDFTDNDWQAVVARAAVRVSQLP